MQVSIHQPQIDTNNLQEIGDVIVEDKGNILQNVLDKAKEIHSSITNASLISNNNDNDVSNLNKHKQEEGEQPVDNDDANNQAMRLSEIEKWPLETSNGAQCEGIFGNGYSKEIISCNTDLSDFKCIQNPHSQQIYCQATNFIINPSMVSVSNGGEEIMEVKMRREDDEFPKYLSNKDTGDTAFNVDCEPQGNIPKKDGISYYFSDIIMFLRNTGVGNKESKYHEKYLSDYNQLCTNDNNDKITIFLITMRYEYANMYHQATDWYNFYQLIHSMGIDSNYEIIFLDGHAKSQIDEAWNYGISGKYNFIKQLNNGQPICLKNALFVSAGYVGGISLKTVFKKCKKESKYVEKFGEWFLKGFGIKQTTERKYNKISITLTCRHDYVAHPRNLKGKASRKFGNDLDVEKKIKEAVKDINDVEFVIRTVSWSDYTFKQQLEIAASTDILIGAHGAGLSHVLFLPRKSGLIEISPMGYDGEPHFEAFSQWCGHKYNQVRGGSEFRVTPDTRQFNGAIKQQVQSIRNNVY